ncbi:zona pellucida-like domain-containing protein 1 [Antennarius striatus]|uniref:zona pellucida-like domain-containing protein 1 n=1 Tax=Antennarius striatus TaxID=241820 RepID=UPI0035AF057A
MAQTPDACLLSETNRPPENEDITVHCGTEYMDLDIYLCPVYQASYTESLMVVNNEVDKLECLGTAYWNNTPPLLRFRFPLNDTAISSCNNKFKTISELGSGTYSNFSQVQFMNISGMINSVDTSSGVITYRQQIQYKFSCLYPMQYFLNNTELAVSGVNLAIKDSNGTFISTLTMRLYGDELYQNLLTIPPTGLNLKTKIYVAVIAQNLTDRFNVLLDRCFATTSPYPTASTYYDLFVGCNRDEQTKVELNGLAQVAYFSFEAFRFVVHKNLTVSTFYLHCITTLCEVSKCSSLIAVCDTPLRRRKRQVDEQLYNTTVSSPVITVGPSSIDMSSGNNYSSPVVAVIICIVILALLLFAMAFYFIWFIRQRKTVEQ